MAKPALLPPDGPARGSIAVQAVLDGSVLPEAHVIRLIAPLPEKYSLGAKRYIYVTVP